MTVSPSVHQHSVSTKIRYTICFDNSETTNVPEENTLLSDQAHNGQIIIFMTINLCSHQGPKGMKVVDPGAQANTIPLSKLKTLPSVMTWTTLWEAQLLAAG